MDPRCPACQSTLRVGRDAWRCLKCFQDFRALRGIPDLRTADDEYLSNADDWALANELNRLYDDLDFRGLLDRYFELEGTVSPAQRATQIDHILSAPGRAGQWVEKLGRSASAGLVLDLGCGTGSFPAAKALSVGPIVGVDIAMRWLILARKRLEEDGLPHAGLICACAENLPFPEASFSAIVAGDVIEHVNDQAATLAEAHRVLVPGGRLVMATPNRFSLAPEPHVGVLGVGFLPRRWMSAYVRLVSKKDFRAISTSGWGEWTALLKGSAFASFNIESPPLPDADLARFRPFKRFLATLHNRLVGQRLGQLVANRVGPLFHIVAEKTCPTASRTTRRHSIPLEASR